MTARQPICYSVLPRFVDPILSGIQDSIICAPSFNIVFAEPSDVIEFYIYSGDGKPPRRLLTTFCTASIPLLLSLHPVECLLDEEQVANEELGIFALRNGFESFAEMRRFIVDTYEVDAIAGRLVRWQAPLTNLPMGAVIGGVL